LQYEVGTEDAPGYTAELTVPTHNAYGYQQASWIHTVQTILGQPGCHSKNSLRARQRN
jgi:hypothetical protein